LVNWHAGQMGTGEIVQSQQAAGANWETVSAGSIGDSFFRFACPIRWEPDVHPVL